MAPVNHATFSRTFAAAHRVWNDDGKCHNIHGHNYRVEIEVCTAKLNEQNFTLPFDVIKTVVDRYDHTLILDASDPLLTVFRATGLALTEVEGVPSTEFLAQLIADEIRAKLPQGPGVATVAVMLRETDSIASTASAQ